MKIVRLQVGEASRLREIRLRSLQDAPDAFGSTYEETIARPSESWQDQVTSLPTFVAVREGVDVGMVRAARDEVEANTAWLISMWVAPEARGSGAGDALIDAVKVWAQEAGIIRVLLDVGDYNEPAIALYRRQGFRRNGVTGALPEPREHITEHQRELRLAPSH